MLGTILILGIQQDIRVDREHLSLLSEYNVMLMKTVLQ